MFQRKVNLLLLFLYCVCCVYTATLLTPDAQNSADKEHIESDSIDNDGACDCGEYSTDCRYTPWPQKLCECESGYSQKGEICSECSCGVHANSCLFHDTFETKICNCTYGYFEVNGICTDTCEGDRDCLPGQKCLKEGDGYFCGCPANYTGEGCKTHEKCVELEPICKRDGASCVIDEDGEPVCRCPPGQTVGLPSGICEDTCNPHRCLHGKCLDIGRGFYVCECDKGYTGRRCEKKNETEACERDSDCLPGQKCLKEGGGYFCGCPANYTGEGCKTHEKCVKLESTCKAMGASCIVDVDGDPLCRCPPGQTVGLPSGICEDTCNPDRCLHGKCLDIGRGFYVCECDKGYTGRRCEEKIETDNKDLIMIIIAVLGVVTAVSIVVNLCFICRRKTQMV